MVAEKTKVRGDLRIQLIDSQGNEKDRRDINNIVVNTGLEYIASRMGGDSAGIMSHMAIGSDSDETNPELYTDLGAALGPRAAITSSQTVDPGTGINNAIQYNATWFAGESTGAVVEAGVFNAATGGTMLARTVFPVINKEADDVLAIEWTITINADV